MNKFLYLFIALFFSYNLASSQAENDDVLFTVDDQPVFVSEFLRVYNKNLDLVQDESQKDIDKYLELYINYKLKLAEARALNFHKKPSYLKEFNSYKKQLSKNYLVDRKVTDDLVNEAYDRMSYDVNARHVLVRIEGFEKDTAEVYNKLLTYRDRYLKEGFDKIKADVHDGSNVFVEDLGYFSAFKMVYEFENAAYNTPVGELSMPIRTQFGYHIVEILDKRKSRGEVTVSHIMISNQQKDSTVIPETRIKEINNLLQQGQAFESLAKQFSDDKSSAKNGGKLSTFKSGQLASVEFENQSFNLQNPGDISQPFKSDYGWHIVKLHEKKPLQTFDELKHSLEQRVRRDSRSKLINSSMAAKLKKKYKVIKNDEAQSYFGSIIDDTYFGKLLKLPETLPGDKVFLTIGSKTYNYQEFANHLRATQRAFTKKMPIKDLVSLQCDAFIEKEILVYHEENLEFENKEFANILNEYREGLLLFDLMDQKVWNAVKGDTVALQQYYEANKQNYKWAKRIDADVYTSASEAQVKLARKALKKGLNIESIKEKLNSDVKQNIIVTSDLMENGHQAIPSDFKFEKGLSEIYEYNNAFHIVNVKEVIPETQKTFDESQGLVIGEYQTIFENKWLKELSGKYNVVVDKEVLGKVKKQINK